MKLPEAHLNSVKQLLGDEFAQWENSFASTPPTSIRINPFKWKNNFPGEQIPWAETGRYLPARPSFTMDPFFHAGYYYVQEASSMGIEQALNQHVDLSKNIRVLDLCGAPGGKSTHLSTLITENSLLVSNEVIRPRANILAENITKWGRDNSIVTYNDPEHFSSLTDFFDVIVADVPCSGEGLFRRDNDAIKEWSTGAVDLCSSRQRRIIHDVWPALKDGGILIYSTCTFNTQENEGNLKILQEKLGFESLELQLPPDWGIHENIHEGIRGYRFMPHRLKGEGFFMSVLQKNGRSNSSPGKIKPALSIANSREKDQVKNFVTNPNDYDFYSHDGTILLFRKTIAADLNTVCRRLNIVQAGLPISEMMKGAKPTHDLAMSVHLNRGAFLETKLSKEDALKFLAKEDLPMSGEAKGISLMTYNGAALGWMNLLGNRANNLYPKEWRIRHL